MHSGLYLFILLALAIDLLLWGLSSVPLGSSSLTLLYALACAHASIDLLIFSGMTALVVRFLMTGALGGDLIVLVPLCVGYYYTGAVADMPRPLLGVAIALGVVATRLVSGLPFTGATFFMAFITAGTMVYLVVGSQGNRSRQ